MSPGQRGGHPPARGAGDHAGPDQERLTHLLDRGGLFPHRDREGRHPDRATAKAAGQRREHRPVQSVQPQLVDVVDRQCGLGDITGDHPVSTHFGVVAHPPQQPVGDARGTAGTQGDLRAGLRAEFDAEDSGGAVQHLLEFSRFIEVHVGGEAESITQRAGQCARPGRRTDEGERGHLQRNRRRPRPFADDDVDPEVLHGQVQHLLGGPGDAVDFVDEQHIALDEVGQHGRQIPGPFQRRT